MIQTKFFVVVCAAFCLGLFFSKPTEAIGLSGANIKAGVNLTREQSYTFYQGVGGEFDSHQWVAGTSLDLGSIVLPNLHFTPGIDIAVQSQLKVYVINTDFVYFFHQNAKGRGYAGAGIGTHLLRPDVGATDTQISLNVPIGFQRKLGTGLGWFGEIKLVIADDERNSALQFSVGLTLGSLE
jgi:hypothetical protein